MIYLFVIVGFLFLVNSCKKDNSATPKTPFKKVATINISDDPTVNYEYNSDGKLSKLSYGNSSINYNTYTYSENTVIILEHYSGIISSDTLFLNSHGYVIKETNGWSTRAYEYDNNGYCTKQTYDPSSNSPSITNYTYINGNLLTEVGNNTGTYTYEYYLDKDNTISNEYKGVNFYGKSNKNLKKQSILSGSSGSDINTYTYEFDQDNYVSKCTTKRNDIFVRWEAYTYK